MSIDERLAMTKQQRDLEGPPQNELMKALKKRKVSVEQSNSVPEKATPTTDVHSPVEKEAVVENINLTTGSPQEDKEVGANFYQTVPCSSLVSGQLPAFQCYMRRLENLVSIITWLTKAVGRKRISIATGPFDEIVDEERGGGGGLL